MSLYQKSVEKKYLNDLDRQVVEEKYAAYFNHFGNPVIQQNIKESKEEEYQEGFVRDLFVNILGYTLKPSPDYNLVLEKKNVDDSKKADGAIIRDEEVIAVIELKSTLTTDLDMVEIQAFGYKNHHPKCTYVITSNFEKIRLYIQNAVEYEEFDLFNLSKDNFALLYLCLSKDSILRDLPLKIKESSVLQEENVTKKLYEDYSMFRAEIFDNIVQNNPQYDQLLLFRKTQKLLDRFLFIFFAEDRLLLPPNSISEIVNQWTDLKDKYDEYFPLYDRFRKYFQYMNTGFKGKKYDIYPYNGGLFLPDDVLDTIKIDDDILHVHTVKLSAYDFETDIDVNILGHIFEHSIAEIENIQAKLRGEEIEKKKTKRKKEGVYYTPKYITKYIVENTVGKICEKKRKELGITDEDYTPHRQKATKKKLLASLDKCREWLLGLTICDPACGSGAFLNQALDFLIKEHHKIDELQANLLGESIVFSDIETDILERNLYGVDINDEAVEIAKLSLWLRTAKKGRKLSTLSNNIKVGNSLIDDPEVAGEKAFKWGEEFPAIFPKKEKKAWHITCATHNSRYSQRMFDNHVKLGEPVWLSEKEEHIVTEKIAEIVEEDKLNLLAYNICGDHMHILLVCEEKEVQKIVQKLSQQGSMLPCPGVAAPRMHTPLSRSSTSPDAPTEEHAPLSDTAPLPYTPPSPNSRGTTQAHLWTQKFGKKEIVSEKQLHNTIEYIRNNRQKHKLPNTNKVLQPLVDKMVCTPGHAFRTEYKGGFDVVIGNPPYVRQELFKDIKPFLQNHYDCYNSIADLYTYFIEKGIYLLNKSGLFSFILPNKFLRAKYGKEIRSVILKKTNIELIFDFDDYPVFEDATTYPIIFIFTTSNKQNHFYYSQIDKRAKTFDPISTLEQTKNKVEASSLNYDSWAFVNSEVSLLLDKIITQSCPLKDHVEDKIFRGVSTGCNEVFIINEEMKKKLDSPSNLYKILMGKEVKRYVANFQSLYLLFLPWEYDIDSNKNVKEYLLENRSQLEKRPEVKEGRFNWWCLSRYGSKNSHLLSKPKIIYPRINNGSNFFLDETGEYRLSDNNFFISSGSKALLALLNSSLSFFFLKNNCTTLQGGYWDFRRPFVEKLPIHKGLSRKENDLEQLAKIQLDINSKLQLIKNNTINLLQIKFVLKNISKKLQNWDELNYSEFLTDLKKAKVQLSLPEEAEWMQYFSEQKQKAQELKSEIDRIDKEIDQMVYALYGLTGEEIRIVEEAVK